MDGLTYKRDDRSKDPDVNEHRKARFREGWKQGAQRQPYSGEALEALTWDNLGYRLGTLLGPTSEELTNRMYDLCVEQQAGSKGSGRSTKAG